MPTIHGEVASANLVLSLLSTNKNVALDFYKPGRRHRQEARLGGHSGGSSSYPLCVYVPCCHSS